jgi:serine/threonine protein kinase
MNDAPATTDLMTVVISVTVIFAVLGIVAMIYILCTYYASRRRRQKLVLSAQGDEESVVKQAFPSNHNNNNNNHNDDSSPSSHRRPIGASPTSPSFTRVDSHRVPLSFDAPTNESSWRKNSLSSSSHTTAGGRSKTEFSSANDLVLSRSGARQVHHEFVPVVLDLGSSAASVVAPVGVVNGNSNRAPPPAAASRVAFINDIDADEAADMRSCEDGSYLFRPIRADAPSAGSFVGGSSSSMSPLDGTASRSNQRHRTSRSRSSSRTSPDDASSDNAADSDSIGELVPDNMRSFRLRSSGLVRSQTDDDFSKHVATARRSGEFADDTNYEAMTPTSIGARTPRNAHRRLSLPQSLLVYAQASAALHEARVRTAFSPEYHHDVRGGASSKSVGGEARRGEFSWDGTIEVLAQLAQHKKDNLEIERSRIELMDEVGHGAFARVYIARYLAPGTDNSEVVAVKQLLGDAGAQPMTAGGGGGGSADPFERERRVFMHEMELMKKLMPHENVVQLIGVCTDLAGPQWIVTEFCAGGALLGYLRDLRARDQRLGRRQTIEMMLQTACGVRHLHQQHIVHRDIAARNMLLAHNGVIKVGDFGLSRNTLEDGYHTRSRTGPLRWMAVESLVQKAYSTRSDIWSFGILMWEIETRGLTPYFHIRNQIELVMQIVREGVRLPAPAGCPLVLVHLMDRCWNELPADRPDMESIVSLLRSLKQEYHADYIETAENNNNAQYSNGGDSSTMGSIGGGAVGQRHYDEIMATAALAKAKFASNNSSSDGSAYYFDEVINAQLDKLRGRNSSTAGSGQAAAAAAAAAGGDAATTAAAANQLAAMFLNEGTPEPHETSPEADEVVVAPKRAVDEFIDLGRLSRRESKRGE